MYIIWPLTAWSVCQRESPQNRPSLDVLSRRRFCYGYRYSYSYRFVLRSGLVWRSRSGFRFGHLPAVAIVSQWFVANFVGVFYTVMGWLLWYIQTRLQCTPVDRCLLPQCSGVPSQPIVQFSSVQFSNFYSGLSDKHHHKDHCSVKCTARWQCLGMTAEKGKV